MEVSTSSDGAVETPVVTVRELVSFDVTVSVEVTEESLFTKFVVFDDPVKEGVVVSFSTTFVVFVSLLEVPVVEAVNSVAVVFDE